MPNPIEAYKNLPTGGKIAVAGLAGVVVAAGILALMQKKKSQPEVLGEADITNLNVSVSPPVVAPPIAPKKKAPPPPHQKHEHKKKHKKSGTETSVVPYNAPSPEKPHGILGWTPPAAQQGHKPRGEPPVSKPGHATVPAGDTRQGKPTTPNNPPPGGTWHPVGGGIESIGMGSGGRPGPIMTMSGGTEGQNIALFGDIFGRNSGAKGWARSGIVSFRGSPMIGNPVQGTHQVHYSRNLGIGAGGISNQGTAQGGRKRFGYQAQEPLSAVAMGVR